MLLFFYILVSLSVVKFITRVKRKLFFATVPRYFARLHEKYTLPVYPIVLFSYQSPLRPEPSGYRIAFSDGVVLEFTYRTP